MQARGKFIVIEGLEGAGKSSAMGVVTKVLEESNIDYIQTREPGGTPMAEAIRRCVKADWDESVDETTELLLMYASRVQLVDNVIKPALGAGKWVIGDRHDLSSQAYQGGGRQLDAALLAQLRTLTLGSFAPDFTLYLDIDPEVGLQRASKRGELDRIEKADLAFFQRTRARYKELISSNEAMVEIDAMQPMQAVHEQIDAVTRQYIQC